VACQAANQKYFLRAQKSPNGVGPVKKICLWIKYMRTLSRDEKNVKDYFL
jgi:hypothetical protein